MAKIAIAPGGLNRAIEFDVPFTVVKPRHYAYGLPAYVETSADAHAPSVYGYGDDDGQITDQETIEGDGWEFVDGYSGQHSYSGPVMHPSETLGGRMERDVLDTPGTYVVVAVCDANDPDGAAYGWALLRRVEV